MTDASIKRKPIYAYYLLLVNCIKHMLGTRQKQVNFSGAFRTATKHKTMIFKTLFILNVISEKKRVLNKERNNTYLAEASIFPRCTTACNIDKYSIMITFWRETSAKSLPPGNSEGSSQNITWFLKTHFNHQFKINITAKRSYQSKIIKFFLFGRRICGCVGRDTKGIYCLN